MRWEKHPDNPLESLGLKADSWRAEATMTTDVLPAQDDYLMYYVGKSGGKDRLGVARCPKSEFDGVSWQDAPGNPLLTPGESGSFDSQHLVDPAAVRWQGSVLLYYSALGDGPDSIGLATSDDGLHFEKHPDPVLVGRAPAVVVHGDLIHLLYSKDNPEGGYEFHLATSEDGIRFDERGAVFGPASSGWDSLSVVTPRVLSESSIWILAYAGDAEEKDRPSGFGLAFSTDMRNWTRYPHNPVLEAGDSGAWDSRAIWFPEILSHDSKYYMWYEGYDGHVSQVGLAVSDDPLGKIGRDVLQLG